MDSMNKNKEAKEERLVRTTHIKNEELEYVRRADRPDKIAEMSLNEPGHAALLQYHKPESESEDSECEEVDLLRIEAHAAARRAQEAVARLQDTAEGRITEEKAPLGA